MGLLIQDDGIVNWGEHTEVEETNHTLMAISSSNEQLSLNEKLTFQANEIYEKDEKLKGYRRIGMKAVKEKEQLQKILDSWKDFFPRTIEIINSGMSSDRKDWLRWRLYSYTSKYSTCQSNDSEGSIGTSSEHSVDPESEISSVPLEVGNWGSAVKTSAGYNWRNSNPNSNCDSGPTFIRTVNAKGSSTEEHDEDVELIVVPSAVKNTEEKVRSKGHFHKFKKRRSWIGKTSTREKVSSTNTSEDNPKIIAFRRELEEIALKHLGTVSENNSTSTPSVNTGNESVNTGRLDSDDSPMPELDIFHKFQMISRDNSTVFIRINKVKAYKAGIFISQDKYVAEILKKFDLVNVKTAITPMETKVALTKDEEAVDVDVTPKTSHLQCLGEENLYTYDKPHLGLWYPRESPFDLEAFSDSDYGGSNLDRKSTTGGCQFLGQRLISWQCKKQTIVATSTTEVEYLAAANSWFAEIVDFLRGSNLRYAFTTNPTIYDSLVKQFWQTATAKTIADGTLELHATIDTTEYKITKASIRDKLHLADASEITMLPNNEIFEGMGK
ncbi:hypothetical protein Tco_1274983 [Tanacetum coccineum]